MVLYILPSLPSVYTPGNVFYKHVYHIVPLFPVEIWSTEKEIIVWQEIKGLLWTRKIPNSNPPSCQHYLLYFSIFFYLGNPFSCVHTLLRLLPSILLTSLFFRMSSAPSNPNFPFSWSSLEYIRFAVQFSFICPTWMDDQTISRLHSFIVVIHVYIQSSIHSSLYLIYHMYL